MDIRSVREGGGDRSIEIFSEDISPQLSVGRVEWICLIFKVFFLGYFGFLCLNEEEEVDEVVLEKWNQGKSHHLKSVKNGQRPSTRLKSVW